MALRQETRREVGWAIWSIVAAFGAYFCMYGFRKPYTAAAFSGLAVAGIGFKTVLISSQVSGYMLSKFIGIKVIAEMPPHRRAISILMMIGFAQVALVLFGLVPAPWNAICLFLNGLPLGMVFGLVLAFLEGRRTTELLAAGLCASFIVADGATKSLGTWLLQREVSEVWMPATAGLFFLPFLLVFVWMLTRIPSPNQADVALRAERLPMDRHDRWTLLTRYALGLTLLVGVYVLVTIIRSIRSDFAPEIWNGLGVKTVPSQFTYSEMLVAFGVLVISGSTVLIRDSRRAFFASLLISGGGILLLATALLCREAGWLSAFAFMVMSGLGLYLPYVAFHTTVFERLLATSREKGNIGFLMYLADSFGYLGFIAVMLSRNFTGAGAGAVTGTEMIDSFVSLCWIMVALTLIGLAITWFYFAVRFSAPALAAAAANMEAKVPRVVSLEEA